MLAAAVIPVCCGAFSGSLSSMMNEGMLHPK